MHQIRSGYSIVAVFIVLTLGATVHAQSSWPSQTKWIEHANQFIETAGWNNLDAFMWFNKDKMQAEGYDWRVTSPSARQAYQNWVNLQPGAYLDGYPNATNDTTVIDTWEADVGHQARIGWFESLMTPFPTANVQTILNRNSTPYIVLEPFDVTKGDDAYNGDSRLQAITAGDYDVIYGTADLGLQRWANTAAELKNNYPNQRIEIVFGQEMNSNWFTWGYLEDYDEYGNPIGAHNGNTPQDFIDAFRHVAEVFDDAGADNVDFVWSMNASWHDDFSEAFPGTDVVDRVGMNGYNRGDFPPGTHPNDHEDFYRDWREFEEIFGQWDPSWDPATDPSYEFGVHNYDRLAEIAPGLPIIIGEFASTPEPGTLVLLLTGGLGILGRRRRRRT